MTAWYARATLSCATPRCRAFCRNSTSEPSRTSAVLSSSEAFVPNDRCSVSALSLTACCCNSIVVSSAPGSARKSAVTRRSRCNSQISTPSWRALRAESAVAAADEALPIWPITNGTATRTTAVSGNSRSRFSLPRTRSLSTII